MDLLDLVEEAEAKTPLLCKHVFGVGKNGYGWTLERNPRSPYYGRWVDANPNCRRPAHLKGEPQLP